jgi:hypothetical protein
MNGVAAEQELYRACHLIFGKDLSVSREFLEYIQLPGIKSAFRKKAFEIHPDRAAFHGNAKNGKDDKGFCSVREAYETLTSYVRARERGFRFSGLRPRSGSSVFQSRPRRKRNGTGVSSDIRPSANPSWNVRKNPLRKASRLTLPRRRLLFGQYLYYSGHIGWGDLVQALVWQRKQRPRLGEIARQQGWLNFGDISTVLRHSTSRNPFGKTARLLGLLSDSQIHSLVWRQKRMQKKFGEYFVEKKMFSDQQLANMLASCRRHNTRYLRPAF